MSAAPSSEAPKASFTSSAVTPVAAATDQSEVAVPTVREFLQEAIDLLQKDSADATQIVTTKTDGSRTPNTITFAHNGIQQAISDDKDGLSKGDFVVEVWTDMPNECNTWSLEISQKGCCTSAISQSVLGLLEGILHIKADENNETLSDEVHEKSFGELDAGSWIYKDEQTGKDHTFAYKVKPSFSDISWGRNTEA